MYTALTALIALVLWRRAEARHADITRRADDLLRRLEAAEREAQRLRAAAGELTDALVQGVQPWILRGGGNDHTDRIPSILARLKGEKHGCNTREREPGCRPS